MASLGISSLTTVERSIPGNSKTFSDITMQFPLVILNTGGSTRFIQDLKLIIKQNGKASDDLYLARILSSMNSRADSIMAQQFAIEGHKAYSACFFFTRDDANLILSPGTCKAIIKAKIDNEGWKTLHEFNFIIKSDQDLSVFNTHYTDNRGS